MLSLRRRLGLQAQFNLSLAFHFRMRADCSSFCDSNMAQDHSILGCDRTYVHGRKCIPRRQIVQSDTPEPTPRLRHALNCVYVWLIAWARWRRHTLRTGRTDGKPNGQASNRVTIPSPGAGLARLPKWTLNFPGPVTGTVRRSDN